MKISNDFYNSLSKFGSYASIECKCGKIHYIHKDYSNAWDDLEWELFEQEMTNNPLNYEEYFESDCIPYVAFNNDFYVVDCSCNSLKKIEETLWFNRYIILDFYKKKEKTLNEEIKKLNNEIKYLNLNDNKHLTIKCEEKNVSKSDSCYITIENDNVEKIDKAKKLLIKEMKKHGYNEEVLTFSTFYSRTNELNKIEFFEIDERL